MFEIWPSLISANIMNLEQVLKQLDDHCHGYHLDIMDNHFVPNLTWGAQFMNAIAQNTKKPLWIHLMIENELTFLDSLFVPKGTYITFHVETASDINALIEQIKNKGWRPSIAVNPDTPIEKAFAYLKHIDQLLLMSVNPGFSGQTFMPTVLKKIEPLTIALKNVASSATIAMDGGINRTNIAAIADRRVQQFGIASGIFSYEDPIKELELLYDMQKSRDPQ